MQRPEVRARMIADGLDPDAEAAKARGLLDALIKANANCEVADEKLLQTTADKADAMLAFYKAFKTMVREFEQNDPLNPKLEEAREFLDALAEEMPKDEDEEE
jgi:predicted kinase